MSDPAATQDPSAASATAAGDRMIEAEQLSRYYGRFTAVEDVSFSVRRGEVVAFLGPNGAGKSTTMKLLTGYLAPSAGKARLCGYDMTDENERLAAANRLGYLPENGPLYQDMTPASLLRFFAEARGLGDTHREQRTDYVVRHCALETVINKPIGKLSRGYRQRVGMATALLHDPDVLILDEPTSGLDPNQIREVRQMIRKLGENKTILLSTHILQEVRQVCGRVLLIADGRLRFDGSVEEAFGDAENLDDRFYELTRKGAAAA